MTLGGALATTPPETVEESEAYPKRFGTYVLLSSFAHGGMGEVYLAKSGGIEGIDRLCVLKKLRPDVAKNKEYLGRFIDEARIVVQLSHANIAHVFDVGAVGDEHYMAMEYISGANAREIVVRARKQAPPGLDPGLATFIVSHALEALDYAHRSKHPITGQPLNLVHRDVSPQNVMVSFEGEVKLIDFGLAASELKQEHTESHVVMGKVAYMSPEQARGENVDAKSDQFSAAVMLYELLTGDRFYGEKSNYEIWQVVGQGGFLPRRWTELDSEMTGILSRALSADVTQRYPTCSEFKDALDIYRSTRFPGATRRALRELLEAIFAKDQDQERRFLAQYADVSAAQVKAVVPGKARSFVAAEASPSMPAPPASRNDNEESDSLPPSARTETAISVPEKLRDDDGVDPTAKVRTLGASGSDNTEAALRAGYPAPRGPLAAAALIILLLLGTLGVMLWPSSDEQPPAVDVAPPAETAPPAEPQVDPPVEVKDDPEVVKDPPVEPAPPTEAAPTETPSERPPQRNDRGSRRVSTRPAATAEKPAEGEPAKQAGATAADAVDDKARLTGEGTPMVSVTQDNRLRLLRELQGKVWLTTLKDEAKLNNFLIRCSETAHLAGAAVLSKRLANMDTADPKNAEAINNLLDKCREKLAE